MKNKILHCALLLVLMMLGVPAAIAHGTAYDDPAAKGEPVKSVVELGAVNVSNYDATITLLDTVRGKEALQRLKDTDPAVKAPKQGYEYLLARVRFELEGRAVSDQGTFMLWSSPFQWLANSADFRQYDGSNATPPEPALKGPVQAGETKAGWIVFEVEQNESKPIMTFDPSSGGATGRGNLAFFKLY